MKHLTYLTHIRNSKLVALFSLTVVTSLYPHNTLCSSLPYCPYCCSVAQSCPTIWTPWTAAHQAPCPSLFPGVCSNSCPLSPWCHPTIPSSVVSSSSCLQSLPASGSFLVSQLFEPGGQGIGTSSSTSVLPMNIQCWFPLGLTGLISLLSKGLSRVFSSTTFFFFCSGFCHTLKWNSHGFTCVPHPYPPSHLPLHPLPLGFPSAPGPSACLMHPTWAGDLFHPR